MGIQVSKVCKCFKTSKARHKEESQTLKYSQQEPKEKQSSSRRNSVVDFCQEQNTQLRKSKKQSSSGRAQINPTEIHQENNSDSNDINNITFRSSQVVKRNSRGQVSIVPDNKPASTISIRTPKKYSLTSEVLNRYDCCFQLISPLCQLNQDLYFDTGDEPDQTSAKIIRDLPQKIRFKTSEVIGQGSFGRVLIGMNKDSGQQLAIKQVDIEGFKINKDDHRLKALEQEIEILSKLEHKNIVRYYGVQKSSLQLNIILEYVAGGSISGMIKKFGPFQENVIKIYMKEITEGLHYLHVNGVMHRDIKGANVLVDKNGVCKLADFGSSKRLGDLLQNQQENQHNSLYGTPNWMAPEVITQDQSGRKADIWSLGCVMIEMATGQPPWGVFSNPFQAIYKISQMQGPPPFPNKLSEFAKDFLEKCLQMNPKQRWTAKKLLMHPFLQQRHTGRLPSIQPLIREKKHVSRIKIPSSKFGSQQLLQPTEKEIIEDLTPEIYKNDKSRKFDFQISEPELSDLQPSYQSHFGPGSSFLINSGHKRANFSQIDLNIESENKFETFHMSIEEQQIQNQQKPLPKFSQQFIESDRTIQEIDFADNKYTLGSPKINVFSPEKDKDYELEFDLKEQFSNSIVGQISEFKDQNPFIHPHKCEKIVEASQESSEKQNKIESQQNLNSLPDEPFAKIPAVRLKSLPVREYAFSPVRQVSFQDRHLFFFSNSYKDDLQII